MRLPLIEALMDGESAHCSTRWESLRFIQDHIDQVSTERLRLEQEVEALGQNPHEIQQQHTKADVLGELLQPCIIAEGGLTQDGLIEEGPIQDIHGQQRFARRQQRGIEPGMSRTEWWHAGLSHVPSNDEIDVW